MNNKVKKAGQNIMQVLSGSILTSDFFAKNKLFLLIAFVIAAAYISNRFTCISKISEIESLKKDLTNARYKSQVISTDLIGIGRQSQVEALVERNGLNLKISKEPKIKLEK
ncbi:hypothetical protein D0T53_04395 [Dysgonomonas sp. 216]|uniref:FtsL-like putative cell division protein n=1 Tax=Dysgonomonas sp. 216 TaxID=2302934 RepID=UPI0013D7F67D|nr:FtsL-like putative cell division protein [Dysgonomonas sp. 216]NDW18157.1 hypothetical protein [Dysgonomonas sp. 216]